MSKIYVACLCIGGEGFALFPTLKDAQTYLENEYGGDLVYRGEQWSPVHDHNIHKYRVAGYCEDFIISLIPLPQT